MIFMTTCQSNINPPLFSAKVLVKETLNKRRLVVEPNIAVGGLENIRWKDHKKG